MKYRWVVLIILALTSLISGCGTQEAVPTLTNTPNPPTATATATATYTPLPPTATSTLTPTATQTATNTPTVTFTVTPDPRPYEGIFEGRKGSYYLRFEVTYKENDAYIHLLDGRWTISCGVPYNIHFKAWAEEFIIENGSFSAWNDVFSGKVESKDEISIRLVPNIEGCGGVEIKTDAVYQTPTPTPTP